MYKTTLVLKKILLVCLFLFSFLSFSQTYTTLDLIATKDNTISLKKDSNNWGSCNQFRLDRESNDLYRALIQFDLSSIPSGAIVESAELRLDCISSASLNSIDVFKIGETDNWDEGNTCGGNAQSNWIQRTAADNWSTEGVIGRPRDPLVPEASYTTPDVTGIHTWDITCLTKDWSNGSAVNNGIMLACQDGGGNRMISYASREATSGSKPTLRVTYTLDIDSDFDGVYDSADIDDDNDGILDSIESNCSPGYVSLGQTFSDNSSNPGTVNNLYSYSGVDVNLTYELEGSAVWSSGVKSQSSSGISGAYVNTQPKNTNFPSGNIGVYTYVFSNPVYNVNFKFGGLDNSDRADFYASNDGNNTAVNLTDINLGANGRIAGQKVLSTAGSNNAPYNSVAVSIPGPVTTLTIEVGKQDGNSGNVTMQFYELDYCISKDSDMDMVLDYFDLDSDNDGIPDIVEAGLGSYSEGTGIIPLSSFTDNNHNGMHDAFESNIPLDSDNDGVPNFMDLDSDNDSVFDVDEARTERYTFSTLSFENGDGDINGDGVGDGEETESFRVHAGCLPFGDGILDIYDYGTGANEYGNLSQGSAPHFVADSDNDGIPDYIDTTSDGLTFDISNTHYSSLDSDNDGVIDDTNDSDKDGIVDLFDTNDALFGSPRDLQKKLDLYFDGRNDYVEDANVISEWGEATIMAWIKIDSNATGDQKIFGQNSFNLQINSDKSVSVMVDRNILSNGTAINTNQWTHIAATYSETNEKLILYINGREVTNVEVKDPLPADKSNLTIGRQSNNNLKYFKGFIEEVRLFSKALAKNELQKIVYQELENNAGITKGLIVPTNVRNYVDKSTSNQLGWSSLKRYYSMDTHKDNVLDDLTTTNIDQGSGARVYNVKNIGEQSAPLPFVTKQSGRLEVAVNDPERGINGNDAINPSAIVKIAHNDVYIDSDLHQVGLVVNDVDSESNPIIFKVKNDSQLNVSWYLKLDGKIDLEGESQLIQGAESYLDPTSSGTLEKDQQGTADTYTYNYWSMPVGVSNNTTNNNGYTLQDVFSNVNFLSSGYNGTSSPLGIADYWIWKYNNQQSNNYASWQHVRSTGTLLPGEGFTMKGPGSGSILTPQNYVLEGKPNNGDINLPIGADNSYLVGNPYPSAIDAHQFILDNGATINGTGSTNGTLYFWEHWGGGSHNLSAYQGGYATYSLAGGIPAAAMGTNHPDVGTGGAPSKVPGRYIPVGQGFFVTAESDGLVNFNNGQRVFQVEDGTNSVFTKSDNTKKNKSTSNQSESLDKRIKLRIGFNSVNTIRRQLLITVDSTTTSGYDWGYDAPYIDTQMDDLYWMIENDKYTIQGIDKLEDATVLPLGIHTKTDGINSIILDKIENSNADLDVFIHDKAIDTYHNLQESNYEVELLAGEYLDRFEIAFSQTQTLNTNDSLLTPIQAYYSNEKSSLIIENVEAQFIETIEMFNILGQSLFKINIDTNKKHLEYNGSQIKTGTYIIKMTTEKGIVSKKVLVE